MNYSSNGGNVKQEQVRDVWDIFANYTIGSLLQMVSHHYHESLPMKSHLRGKVFVGLFFLSPIWMSMVTLNPYWVLVCSSNYLLIITSLLLHLPRHPTLEYYELLRKLDITAVFLCITANLLPGLHMSYGLFCVTSILLLSIFVFSLLLQGKKEIALVLGSIVTTFIILFSLPLNALTFVSFISFVLAAIFYLCPDQDRPELTLWRKRKWVGKTNNNNLEINSESNAIPEDRLWIASHDFVQFCGAIVMLCMFRVNYTILFD